MSDAGLIMGAAAVLGMATAVAVLLRTVGVPATYVRDLMHIGAGLWVLTWPWWHGAAAPIAITAVVAVGTALVPLAARRIPAARRLHGSVTGGDERWGGLVLYTLSYAALTATGFTGAPLPAAAALLALSLGDGVGGAVGRHFGRRSFRAPGGKRKTVEGTITVGLMATAGALIAGAVLGAPMTHGLALVAGLVAAVVEAASPRGTDNATVPAAVWLTLEVLS
ncbi:MAG TPA: hypothetical protein VL172_12650 [Kofleriaceae bacterium]|nr:hypothetical protein [Kofleriaceae bacterium]